MLQVPRIRGQYCDQFGNDLCAWRAVGGRECRRWPEAEVGADVGFPEVWRKTRRLKRVTMIMAALSYLFVCQMVCCGRVETGDWSQEGIDHCLERQARG